MRHRNATATWNVYGKAGGVAWPAADAPPHEQVTYLQRAVMQLRQRIDTMPGGSTSAPTPRPTSTPTPKRNGRTRQTLGFKSRSQALVEPLR